MSILVTGSAGHLGEALMRTFRAQGTPAIGVDIKHSEYTDRVGNIADRDFVKAAMRGIRTVIHTATLHKPHVATHTKQDFVDTNITGTLNLLEEAVGSGVSSFVFTSTTSTFGAAMNPAKGAPAAWITEEVVPQPKNIYSVTKLAAESLCELFHRKTRLPVLILRTSRFFPEDDDNAETRRLYNTPNVQALELLYRRVDIADAVSAHLLAMEKAGTIGFGKYIISATTPFTQAHLAQLHTDAPAVIRSLYRESESLFTAHGWKFFPEMDRVYVNERARRELGWAPVYDFAHVLRCLREDTDFRSPLAVQVGSKGYHDEQFDEGPFPVE
ncbi:NAD-dependent epimerase/dehydratase family protein [Dyadobacter fermentans]|uniref:NAD-dependent epimerase/dehydratase n=1 Tax=Dyadobacter fermentans (strain ATCC 700827 / DSM 18053 / CIP 107007 / KCTC 52180 / NS114) TaxID=471854 RepID=C6VYN5_DYAFD|nr:NAD(P)-dependent oxidoreductase [Dyadobacter fermentans]ACT93390.1 NAD-dependent epimerase/dehydratase [Dyadobacter fermentans DSM 18053]